MKSLLLRALLVLICVAGSVQVSAKNEKGLVGAIKVETPKRPKGQKDVLLLIAPKLDTVRVGFIGVGTGESVRWKDGPRFLVQKLLLSVIYVRNWWKEPRIR